MNNVTIRHTAKGTIIETMTHEGIEVRWIPAATWARLLAEHAGTYPGDWVADEDHPDALWQAIAYASKMADRPLPGKLLRAAR